MDSTPQNEGVLKLTNRVVELSASLATGSLFAFLFRVPRTLAAERGANTPDDELRSRIVPNTNLEQVSDWLTKILIGATLVQLGSVPSAFVRLTNAIASALGGQTSAAAFAGATVIYIAVMGFFLGWLNARLYLGKAMRDADVSALMARAEAARRQGHPDEAQRLSEAAELRARSIEEADARTGPTPSRVPQRFSATSSRTGSLPAPAAPSTAAFAPKEQ